MFLNEIAALYGLFAEALTRGLIIQGRVWEFFQRRTCGVKTAVTRHVSVSRTALKTYKQDVAYGGC